MSIEPVGERLIWALTRCYHRLTVLSDVLHSPFGVSSGERATLLMVAETSGLTISRIADARGVSRQFIQRIVAGLISRGWLAAEANARHARSPCLSLTQEGIATLIALRKRERALWSEIGDDLLDADSLCDAVWPIEQLTARVDRVITRLD